MILLKFMLYGIITISVFIINYIYNTHIYKKYILGISEQLNKSKQIFNEYNNWKVISIYICRQPINTFLNKCINFITFDTFNILCKNLNYNNIYHISFIFIIKLDDKYKIILVDKQHTILLSDTFTIHNATMEFCSVQLKNKNNKFGDMINKVYDINKEQYLSFDIISNNCQTFAYDFMIANELLTDNCKKFILQDLKSVENDIPKYSHKFANGIVYIYSTIENKLDYYWKKIFNTSILEDLKKIDDEHLVHDDGEQSDENNDA